MRLESRARVDLPDRIELSDLEMPERVSVSSISREIMARFQDQEFTYKHLYACLLKDSRVKNRSGLNDLCRWIVRKECERGNLELVSRGGIGVCSVYKNAETGARQC